MYNIITDSTPEARLKARRSGSPALDLSSHPTVTLAFAEKHFDSVQSWNLADTKDWWDAARLLTLLYVLDRQQCIFVNCFGMNSCYFHSGIITVKTVSYTYLTRRLLDVIVVMMMNLFKTRPSLPFLDFIFALIRSLRPLWRTRCPSPDLLTSLLSQFVPTFLEPFVSLLTRWLWIFLISNQMFICLICILIRNIFCTWLQFFRLFESFLILIIWLTSFGLNWWTLIY